VEINEKNGQLNYSTEPLQRLSLSLLSDSWNSYLENKPADCVKFCGCQYIEAQKHGQDNSQLNQLPTWIDGFDESRIVFIVNHTN